MGFVPVFRMSVREIEYSQAEKREKVEKIAEEFAKIIFNSWLNAKNSGYEGMGGSILPS